MRRGCCPIWPYFAVKLWETRPNLLVRVFSPTSIWIAERAGMVNLNAGESSKAIAETSHLEQQQDYIWVTRTSVRT